MFKFIIFEPSMPNENYKRIKDNRDIIHELYIGRSKSRNARKQKGDRVFENKKRITELYQQYENKKIIIGIKDEGLKIKYMDGYIWIFPLLWFWATILPLIVLEYTMNMDTIMQFLNTIGSAIATIILFLWSFETIYFENNKIIVKNKLARKKIFDVAKYPIIYITRSTYININNRPDTEVFMLNLEQNGVECRLGINNISVNKMIMLLENMVIAEKTDATPEYIETSDISKKQVYSDFVNIINDNKRIVGVRDKNKKIKIKRWTFSNDMSYFMTKIGVLISIGLIILFAYFEQWIAVGLIALLFITMLVMLLEMKNRMYLKIFYPSENTIRIGKYYLDYKNNIIIIKIKSTNEGFKLFLIGTKDQYDINIPETGKQNLEVFINNLILE